MSDSHEAYDFWRYPAIALWTVFFMVGLYPETFYYFVRMHGEVVSQRAMVNNYWLVDFAWSAYLGWFVHGRCREAGLSSSTAVAKGVQVAILGLTAFVPIHLESFREYLTIPVVEYRWILMGGIAAKLITWLYLAVLVFRYYIFSGYEAFINMPVVFPSGHDSSSQRNSDGDS